jgi:hypothetical protein
MQRANNKWNVNEILSLQREYELLEMSIDKIAERHKRSAIAIAYKLKQEGFIDSLDDARGIVLSTRPGRATGNWKKPIKSAINELDISMPPLIACGNWKPVVNKSTIDSRMASLEVSLEHILLLLSLSSKNTKDNISLNIDNLYEAPY